MSFPYRTILLHSVGVALSAALVAPSAALAQSLVPMEPVTCSGSQVVVVQYRLIEADGVAVAASGSCSVTISDSRIVAGTTAVQASGSAAVEISDSVLSGATTVIHASGRAEVGFSGSRLHGAIHRSAQARVRDDGGNDLAAAPLKPGARTTDPAVSVRAAPAATEIRTGPAGVDISSLTGGQVQIGPGGVVVREGGQDVQIDAAGQVRAREHGRETLIDTGPGGAVAVSGAHGELVRVDAAGRFHVVEGDSVVTMDGGWVGIRHGDQAVDVHLDEGAAWRSHPGSVQVETDSATLLARLGAVERGDVVHVQLAGDVLFDFDSAAILADAARSLAEVGALIRQRARARVEVLGHTDSIGTERYNEELSRRRALAVMAWLSEREGVPAGLMAGRGLGAKQPVAHNTRPDGSDDPEGRARNRRVEISIR
jgi:outer membrane protein OmpA-like peptidoglycan-associated protein